MTIKGLNWEIECLVPNKGVRYKEWYLQGPNDTTKPGNTAIKGNSNVNKLIKTSNYKINWIYSTRQQFYL